MKNFKRFFILTEISIVALFEIILAVVHLTIRSDGGGLPWWAFVLPAALYVTVTTIVVCLYYRLKAASEDAFERRLSDAHFNVQRRYRLNNGLSTFNVCIDFDGKLFACDLLYKDIIPFSRIANCRMELDGRYRRQTIFSVVMSLHGNGADPDKTEIEIFDNVTLFRRTLPAEVDEITDDLPERFPELQIAFDLQKDMDRIYAVNAEDGFGTVIVEEPKAEDWVKPDDYDEPHFTKPPHSDL